MGNLLTAAIDDLSVAPKTNIKGKQYATVVTRIEIFRKHFGHDYSVTTETIDSYDPDIVRVKATVSKDGMPIATGLAEEDKRQGKINQTSALENAETSAIGRALACFGLLGGEYASAFEMEYALTTQHNLAQAPQKSDFPGDWPVSDPAPNHASVQSKAPQVQRNVPSVNSFETLYQPQSSHPDDVRPVYETIDSINDLDLLYVYYNSLTDLIPSMQPEDQEEIKATFKARDSQLQQGQ